LISNVTFSDENLLDCELIIDTPKQTCLDVSKNPNKTAKLVPGIKLLIFDAMFVNGMNVCKLKFSTRRRICFTKMLIDNKNILTSDTTEKEQGSGNGRSIEL